MASVREQIVVAAIAALNAGTPGGVPAAERTRSTAVEEAGLPSIIVYPTRETSASAPAHGPIVHRRLTLAVECRAKGDGTVRPDQAVDPLVVWVIKALAGSVLGGLAHVIEEGDITFAYEQGEAPLCLAVVEMVVEHQHLVTNPESRV